jgi:hypothetical protein
VCSSRRRRTRTNRHCSRRRRDWARRSTARRKTPLGSSKGSSSPFPEIRRYTPATECSCRAYPAHCTSTPSRCTPRRPPRSSVSKCSRHRLGWRYTRRPRAGATEVRTWRGALFS